MRCDMGVGELMANVLFGIVMALLLETGATLAGCAGVAAGCGRAARPTACSCTAREIARTETTGSNKTNHHRIFMNTAPLLVDQLARQKAIIVFPRVPVPSSSFSSNADSRSSGSGCISQAVISSSDAP